MGSMQTYIHIPPGQSTSDDDHNQGTQGHVPISRGKGRRKERKAGERVQRTRRKEQSRKKESREEADGRKKERKNEGRKIEE